MTFWSIVGGLVIGFGIVIILSAFASVEVAFNASLLGLGISLITLGLTIYNKIKMYEKVK